MLIRNELAHVGTYAWAAEVLGVSVAQVGRYVKDGLLSVASPKCGRHESSRRFLLVDEVLEFKHARAVVGRG
jgi:predicted site-specific integrase-resolvase